MVLTTRAGSWAPTADKLHLCTCLLFVALLCLGGCSGDTTSPTTRNEIVVFGYLYVGESLDEDNAILIARTMPVDEYYDPEDAVIEDALVTVTREGSSPDTLRMVRPGYYANPDILVDPLTTYHLRVEIDGEDPMTATTTTPLPFTMTSIPREIPGVMRHEDIPDSFSMKLTCGDPDQIFLLDVYCLEEWQDARYINPFGNHEKPDDYDEYGRDNEEPRHIYAFFRIKNVEKEDELYRISFYSAMMVFYGRYAVQLMSIDKNQYNYLWKEHPEESGGIVGGIGVFGSACRERYEVEVVE